MPGKSDMVRQVVIDEYVEPARLSKGTIRIRQGDLKAKMVTLGFPARNANQIGTSIEAEKFWRPLGLELCSPKGQSRSADTIYEFKFVGDPSASRSAVESPEERAFRLTEKLRGLMKDEIAAHGGTEGFMRWVRSDEDEDAG